jgi:DNA polymerase-1
MSAAQAQEIPDLLRAAAHAGVRFRLSGAKIVAADAHLVDPQAMQKLRDRRDELWCYLGGKALDQPSLDLMATRFKHIQIVTPQSEPEALDIIAQIQADADAQTERYARGVVGLDIETMANAGEEERQWIHLRRDGVVQQPAHPALDPEKLRRKGKPGSTAGLDPDRSTIRLVQLYGGGNVCLVLDTKLAPLTTLVPVLSRRRMVIHNAAFELRLLHRAGIDVPRFECSMQAAGLMLGVHRRSLEDVAQHHLGIALPKELQLSDWGAEQLSPGQLAYAALDAIIAWQLWPWLIKDVIKAERGTAYVVQREVIPPVMRMQARGAGMSLDAHRQQVQHWRTEHTTASSEFLTLTGQAAPETPAEIRILLTRVLPAEVLRDWPRTAKTGLLSTAGKQLLKQAVNVPALVQLCAIKKADKLLSSFGDTLAARVGRDGRIHAGFNIASTKTGRMSCGDPNLQQLPRNSEFRNCFAADNGNILVVADYSTMELRAAAEISNDDVLRQDFKNGVNLHRRTAAQMFDIPEDQVTPAQRQAAKPINFGVIYGAGGVGLAASAWAGYGVAMTPAQAQSARDQLLARYRTLARWMHDHAGLCQHRGTIAIGRHGRVIIAEWEGAPALPPITSYDTDDDDDDDDWDSDDENALDGHIPYSRNYPTHAVSPLKYTLCCNAPVQGACADIIMCAITLIDRALTEAGIPGGLVLAVHDELVLEVPADRADEAKRLLQAAMEQAFAEYFPTAPINGLVEARITKAWGESKV